MGTAGAAGASARVATRGVGQAMFLVMDHVNGRSLRDIPRPLCKAKGRMPIGNALRILIDALAGLHAAPELCGKEGEPLGLVHRDVSPHNILVGADGISKITDFGVTRANARLTSRRPGPCRRRARRPRARRPRHPLRRTRARRCSSRARWAGASAPAG